MDELSSLALLRAREQGRALLGCLRGAMVEVDQPHAWPSSPCWPTDTC
jgi:hypothetical protein